MAELRDTHVAADSLLAVLRPAMAFFCGQGELSRRWAEENIDSGGEWTRATTRMFLASFAENSGDTETMRTEMTAALRDFRRIGERWGLASALRGIAQLRTLDGDLTGAAEAYEEALALTRQLKSNEDQVVMHLRLADLALRRGSTQDARRFLDDAEQASNAGRSHFELLYAAAMQAEIEWHTGDRERAGTLLAQARAGLDSLADDHPAHGHIHAAVVTIAGRVNAAAGRHHDALADACEAYAAAVGTGDMPLIALVGVLVAAISEPDDPERAARVLGAADRLRGGADPTAVEIAQLTAALRDRLGNGEFASLYGEGRALPREAALAVIDPNGQARVR